MKLWILRPIITEEQERKKKHNWEPWYDKVFGFIIRANSSQEARELAQKKPGSECGAYYRKKVWLDPAITTCKELKQTGKTELIMYDFRAA